MNHKLNRNVQKESRTLLNAWLDWTDLAIRLTLLTQLAIVALLFTGRFSNPQAHKEYHGALLGALAFGLLLVRTGLTGHVSVWRNVYLPPLGAFALWAAIRAFTSPTPESQYIIAVFLGMVAAFPVWLQQLKSPAFRSLLVWSIVVLGAFMASGALVMSFGWLPLNLTRQYARHSVGSWVGHNNPMAMYLLVAICFGAGLWWRNRTRAWSIVLIGLVLIELYLILLSGSRGVWLTSLPVMTLMALCVYWITGGRLSRLVPPRLVAGIGIVVVVTIGVVGIRMLVSPQQAKLETSILSRFVSLRETFAGTYPRAWWLSLLMFKEHPVAGVGFNAWAFHYPDMQGQWFTNHPDTLLGLPEVGKHTQRAHNDFFQMLAELGLVGLGLFSWISYVHLREVWRYWREEAAWDESRLIGLLGSTGILGQALFYFPFHEAVAATLFLASLALFAVKAPPLPEPREEVAVRPRAFTGVVVFAVALGMALLFWFVTFGHFERVGSGEKAVFFPLAGSLLFLTFLAVIAPPFYSRVKRISPSFSGGRCFLGAAACAAVVAVTGGWFGLVASADQRMGMARSYKIWADNPSLLQQVNGTRISYLVEAIHHLQNGLKLLPYHADMSNMNAEVNYEYAREAEDNLDAFRATITAYEHAAKTYRFYEADRVVGQCYQVLYRYYRDQGDTVQAEEYYQKALSFLRRAHYIYPFHFDIVREIGLLLNEHGEAMEALRLYERTYYHYQTVVPNFAEHLMSQGRQAADAGFIQKAQFLMNTASALEPKNRDFITAIVDFYMKAGYANYAFDSILSFLKHNPSQVDLLRKVFDPIVLGGDDRAALEGMRQLMFTMGEQPLEGWVPVNAVRELVTVYLDRKEIDKAVALCNAALDMLDPGPERDAIERYKATLNNES